jgi:small subunit ribosomal protein S9
MSVVNPYTWGLGRRKSAVARVRIKPGTGRVTINGKEANDYFPALQDQKAVQAPLAATESGESYDVWANVQGGGPTGQSGAVKMGLARALREHNPAFYELLKENGLLTRDSRMKERKKYGRRGARRGFQFSKR